MAQVKLSLAKETDEKVVTTAGTVHDCLKNNPNYTTPNPPLADLLALKTAAQNILSGEKQARELAKQKLFERKQIMKELRGMLSLYMNYVQNTSDGDPVKIESAGMQVRKTPSPVGPLNPPANLRVKLSSIEGQLNVSWKKSKGSSSSELQQKNGSPDATWATIAILTQNKYAAKDLVSGANYSFRIRAIGTAGPSGWTETVTQKAM